jgi:hypothetical protein
MKKYTILGFDMETDIGSYLKTYNGLINGTEKIVGLLGKYDIKTTFFFTGDAAANNGEIVRDIVLNGHEAGCHSLRHETVGDAAFNMPNDSPILEEELEHRLQINRQIVMEMSGKTPVSFRAPRLWQGQGQIMVLEKLGFKVDASYSVAAHKKQILPYHPSGVNWLERGDMKLLEVPNFAFLDTGHDYSQYFCKNDQWPLLRLLGAEFVFEHSRSFIEKQQELSDTCILLFYLHPWEFEAMPDKFEYDEGTFYFKPELYKNCGEPMLKEFEKYVQLSLNDGREFITCEHFYELWEIS